MGATNVKRAYAIWAGKVPPQPMVVLLYMALVSMDSDRAPWFGQGHEALAEHALGRKPAATKKELDANQRAVERAVAPLLEAGALIADRKPAPRANAPRTGRYRLSLGREDVPRNASDEPPTESVPDVPRNTSQRPTETVDTSHGNRGTEEEEETGGEKGGVNQSVQAPEADRPPTAQPDGLTDEPSHAANGKARRAADEIAARRWLGEEYYLPDDLAAQVVAVAEKRSPTPIKYLVPYLRGMQVDKDGTPKRDLADIVEAVQLHGHQADDDQELDDDPYEEDPPAAEPERVPLAVVPPTVTGPSTQRGPGKAAQAALDATHAKICNTVGCERCARVRAEQELASA